MNVADYYIKGTKQVGEWHDMHCRNDDARTTLLWAETVLGYAVVPASAISPASRPQLQTKAIDEPRLRTQLAVITPKHRYLSSIARQFIDALTGHGA